MAKSKNTSSGINQRSSKTGQFVEAKDATSAPKTLTAEPGGFRVRYSSSGGMVIGRNAVTGKFVIAPAVKAGGTFKKMKRNVVREVIKDRRSK